MSNTHVEQIKATLAELPNSPGVYEFYDDQKKVLYVGKAKKLKKRVQSYFQKEQVSARLKVLVKKFIAFSTLPLALIKRHSYLKII